MLNFLSSCNVFVSRIASETPKEYRNRWWDEFYAIVDKHPDFKEVETRDGFWIVAGGERVAYFSDLGHFG